MARPSGTWAMPARAILYAGLPVRSIPSSLILPSVLGTNPLTTRATVDFPAPLEPSKAVTPPAGTVKLTSKRARYGP